MNREYYERRERGAYATRDGAFSIYRSGSRWAVYKGGRFREYAASLKAAKLAIAVGREEGQREDGR